MHEVESENDGCTSDPWAERNRELALLLVRCRTGDTAAFEQLYLASARWLLARIRRIVDDGQAEDVLAEVFIQVWTSLDKYDGQRAPPASWLAMIARTRALDHLRREKRHGSDRPAEDTPAHEPACDEGPEELVDRLQQTKRLELSMATLDEQERMVLGLAYVLDCTHSEISDMTAMPMGTVKSLMARAQQKLRSYFAARAAPGARASMRTGLSL